LKTAQARRPIAQQDFVWRQIVLRQVALKVVASNQAAEQAVQSLELATLMPVLGA